MERPEAWDLVSTKVTNYIDYSDFERIVREVYGQNYDFVADQEASNDSCHEFSAKRDELPDSFDVETLAEFMETGKGSYLAGLLLADLVRRDYMPEGHYIINVYW